MSLEFDPLAPRQWDDPYPVYRALLDSFLVRGPRRLPLRAAASQRPRRAPLGARDGCIEVVRDPAQAK